MYLNRRAPYGTIYAVEGLEVVLIGAAFDQNVCMAFVGDGVYQLKTGQDTSGSDMKNFSPAYRALGDYDVTRLYVERESLEERGLTVDEPDAAHLGGRGRRLGREAVDPGCGPHRDGASDRRAGRGVQLLTHAVFGFRPSIRHSTSKGRP